MNAFFENLPPLLQGFWWVALIASAIFLIQTVLTFTGAHHDVDGINADFNGDLTGVHAPFQMFSLRNLINFLMGFGWTGVAFYHTVADKTILIVLAALVGVFFVLLFFFIIRQLMKLTEDNTLRIEALLGKSGEVYLSIPANRAGAGKVQVSYNNTSYELPAITEGALLPSGSVIKVVTIENNLLVVTKA